MKLSEYQQKAIAFANPNLSPEMAIATRGMGLAGETGELIDLLKKHLEQGHPLDFEKVKKELGDCLWYVNAIACHFELDLQSLVPAVREAPFKAFQSNFLLLDMLTGDISKGIFDHIEYGDTPNLNSRLSRTLGLIASISHHFGFTLEEIAAANIEKLTARYGEKFSVERSINRSN